MMPLKFLKNAQQQARIAAIEEILSDFQGYGHETDMKRKAIELCLMFEEWIDKITEQIEGKSNG